MTICPRRTFTRTVNHAERYVNGRVSTNSLENFWSLFKRNLRGTYVSVEPFHLDRYLDEQVFRFNKPWRQEERRARFRCRPFHESHVSNLRQTSDLCQAHWQGS